MKNISAIPIRKDSADGNDPASHPAKPSPPAHGHEETAPGARQGSTAETTGSSEGGATSDRKRAEPAGDAKPSLVKDVDRTAATQVVQSDAPARPRAATPQVVPETAKPETAKADTSKAVAIKPETAKAVATKAVATKPETAKAVTAKTVTPPDLPAAFQQGAVFQDLSENPASVRRRKFLLALSAVVGIVLPGLLAIAYYGFIASNQFITEVRFLVKSGGPVTPDLLGQLTGAGSGFSTFLDAQTVTEYLRSRQIIEDLRPEIDLREVFSRPSADFLVRLPADASIEDLTEYWQSMVDVSTEVVSGIVTVSVRTFSPEDSARLSEVILRASERLVNQLSARARADTVRFATEDLQNAEARLRLWRNRVYQLREKEQTLDAATTAQAHAELVGEFEAELAKARSELQYRRTMMSENAPLIVSLKSRIVSLRDAIERVRREATTVSSQGSAAASGSVPTVGNRDALTTVLSGFEEAQAELGIAEEYYKSALRYVEESRAEADRQQAYVAVIVGPNMAEESRYPHRIEFIVLAVFVSGILWGLTMLIVFSVRDHLM